MDHGTERIEVVEDVSDLGRPPMGSRERQSRAGREARSDGPRVGRILQTIVSFAPY
jgi:hypothetical protein